MYCTSLNDYPLDELDGSVNRDREAERLLQQCCECSGEIRNAQLLLEAEQILPENIPIKLALYRYYYQGGAYAKAQAVAQSISSIAAASLGFTDDWRHLDDHALGYAVHQSLSLLLLYLISLKSIACLSLRLGKVAEGTAILTKLSTLDRSDRLRVRVMLRRLASLTR